MLIVDAQVHIWAPNTAERPWPARHQPQQPEPVTKDDILREMATAHVDRAVLVPPSWEGDRNDIVLAASRMHPDRFAVMGRFDPTADASKTLLANWLSQRGMLGLRFSFGHPLHQPILTTDRFRWIWSEAEKCRIPIMMSLPHALSHLVAQIAERHPTLKLIIDHLGLTQGKDDEAFRDFYKLLALSKAPSVAVKASGLPFFTNDVYPYRKLHPYLRRAYDSFGPQRIFWGSDLTRVSCTYQQCVSMFTDELAWLSSDDLDWIMGRGLCNCIGWKI